MGLNQKAAVAERRAMVAIFAVFALLVQALFAAPAMAGPAHADGLTICTPLGEKATPSDSGAPPAGQHSCSHCICVADASPPVAPAATVVAVRYATPAFPAAAASAPRPGRGLAAPPPPATGPPSIV